VTLDNLVVLEQVFSLNVYVLQETEAGDIAARLVRRYPYSYQATMNLNLYEDHFSYVSNIEKYSHSFVHGLHQLNTPSLEVAGKSLEGRLWHQWDVGSTC
jgi:hypothetical protein